MVRVVLRQLRNGVFILYPSPDTPPTRPRSIPAAFKGPQSPPKGTRLKPIPRGCRPPPSKGGLPQFPPKKSEESPGNFWIIWEKVVLKKHINLGKSRKNREKKFFLSNISWKQFFFQIIHDFPRLMFFLETTFFLHIIKKKNIFQ